ncbi:unnamed protein product [Mytilus coruscus]|uniref:Uncharacterized protein n=1 Tax=Mytilus coruscus TaxID=42192 RepID=A0A6J8DH92_MYTCO|nr:unnamed protein product [Mytilus coruscus]
MNFCNFAKVILSRCTKYTSAINWWNNPDKTNIENPPPSFNTSLTLRTRHENYTNFMRNYPKMQIDYKTMEKRLTRIQSYLTSPKYWQHDNKDGQRQEFYQNLSIYSWTRLSEIEKKKHQLTNCNPYFHKYSFDRDAFLQEIKSKEPGSIVTWSRLAKKYDLKINNRVPLNGGQVLMDFARSKGVRVFQFNKHTRISGRDFKRRVRKSIKRIVKSRVSVPTPRTAHKIHTDVQTRTRTGEINIGMPIAPKTFKKDLISPDGTLTENNRFMEGN